MITNDVLLHSILKLLLWFAPYPFISSPPHPNSNFSRSDQPVATIFDFIPPPWTTLVRAKNTSSAVHLRYCFSLHTSQGPDLPVSFKWAKEKERKGKNRYRIGRYLDSFLPSFLPSSGSGKNHSQVKSLDTRTTAVHEGKINQTQANTTLPSYLNEII